MMLTPIVLVAQNQNQQQQVLQKAFERMVFASRFEKVVDLSDLGNITEQNVKNIYAWMINNLGPLSTYFQIPEPNTPSWFFQKTNGKWNKKIEMRVATADLQKIKAQANQLSNQLFEILKFLPNTNNQNDYIYWVYYFVSNWISYTLKAPNNQNIIGGLLDRKGICESYAKLTKLLFNVIDVESVYQTGILGSGIAAGPHIWNKYKIGDKWFNFDTTSAATANRAYYLLPVGDFLSFNDSDFPNKRTQDPNWYETKPVANFDTASLNNLIPYRNDLPYKKVVYNDKWYYFDFKSREIIESNIDGSNRIVIKKVNREANENYRSADIVYLVGNKLYWIDKNEENKVVISEYDLETRTTNINYQIIDLPSNTNITETKLSINELKITTYNGSEYKTLVYKLNPNYNFFNTQNSKFVIRSLASVLGFWFTQFDIGSNVGQFKNEQLYWKYQNILIKGLTATEYNESLYNQLINFKADVENDLNKVAIPRFDIEIDASKTISEYSNLIIEPTVAIENATDPKITYQWQQSSNGSDWTNIVGQTNKNLMINNITKEWNNKKVKVMMRVSNNGEISELYSGECTITITEPNLPIINLNYSPNKTEWEASDNITFNFSFSLKQNLTNIKLYKKEEQNIEEISTIVVDQNVANYIVKKEDLEKDVEFYIEANYFDRKIKSNILTIKFIPKFNQMINNENKTEINQLDVDNEFTLSVSGGNDGLTYQWNFDKNYFKLINNSQILNSITLKVIKNSKTPQVITCNIRRNRNDIKVISYTATFKNNPDLPIIPDPEKPSDSNKSNNLPIIIGTSIGSLMLILATIITTIIFKKKK